MRKSSLFWYQKSKKFLGRGTTPSPDSTPSGEGDTPSPHPLGASTPVLHFLGTGHSPLPRPQPPVGRGTLPPHTSHPLGALDSRAFGARPRRLDPPACAVTNITYFMPFSQHQLQLQLTKSIKTTEILPAWLAANTASRIVLYGGALWVESAVRQTYVYPKWTIIE